MNELDLSIALTRDPLTRHIFKGVFSVDSAIDKPVSYPVAYIFNTKPSRHPGEHWFALYIRSSIHKLEFFCSYGIRPPAPLLRSIGRWTRRSYVYNSLWLQSPISLHCGYYCIYFIYNRCRGLSFSEIKARFTHGLFTFNDRRVVDFYTSFTRQ